MNITEMERTQLAKEDVQLAHERTFLAWLRTGLLCALSGFLIIRLLSLQAGEHELLALVGGAGLVLLAVGMFIKAALNMKSRFMLFLGVSLSALSLFLAVILL